MNRVLSVALSAAFLLIPSQARAHARLTHSLPAQGSSVAISPTVIRLWFSESPELSMTLAQLSGSDGKAYRLGTGTRQQSGGLEIDFPVQDSLPAGEYTLVWRAAAADGHPTHGKFTFVVLAPAVGPAVASPVAARVPVAAAAAPAADTSLGDDNAAASAPNSLARSFLFLGLLLLIGAVTFSLFVVPRAGRVEPGSKLEMTRRAAMLGMIAAVAIVAAALLRLYFESKMMNAMPDMPGMAGVTNQQMVMQTTWGLAFLTQIIAAVVAFVSFFLARRGLKAAWYIALVAALSLAITPALSGHAAASPRFTSAMVVSDWLHVLGAASWLGSLACVMMIGVPMALKQDGDERWKWVSALVNEFSRLALVAVGVVVASGVFASWMHLARLSDLWTTTYGKTLIVKLVLVSVTLAIGAYNYKRVQPRLDVEQGTIRLRKSATLELATGFLILLVSGFLTGVSP